MALLRVRTKVGAMTLDDIAEEFALVHEACGLDICEHCANTVAGEGNAKAEIMFVGEAPGATEDREGRPFVGKAGKLLDAVLESAELWREDVFITNIVKARPPDNRDPTPEEIEHYLPWLEVETTMVNPLVIVPLGRFALQHFAPTLKVSIAHGVLLIDKKRPFIFPMYHPSAALHDSRLKQTLHDDAEKLQVVLELVS